MSEDKKVSEKESWGWQLQLLQQQIAEWWEWETSRFEKRLMGMPLPNWFDGVDLQTLWFWVKVIIAGLLVLLLLRLLQRLNFSDFPGLLRRTVPLATNPEPSQSSGTWVGRSHQFQKQGRYREACFCLYMAMLQQLNDLNIAPHQLSRTDGEYAKLVESLPQHQAYQTLLLTHQELCFDSREASRSDYERCQHAYQTIKLGQRSEGRGQR